VDLAAGLLSESEAQELQKHLNSCADCRSLLQALQNEENVLADYFARLEAETARRQERVLRALERSSTTPRATRSLWRTIMTSRYGKFGAIAATLALAAIATLFLSRSTPAYALTDLPATFDQARVIHLRGRHYFSSPRKPDGAEVPSVETNNWIDLANHRYRYTSLGASYDGKGNVTIRAMEMVCNGPYTMMVNPEAKMVFYMRSSDLNREVMTYRLSRMAWMELWGRPDQLKLAEFVKVGRENMDGTVYDIWQWDMAPAAGGDSGAPGSPVVSPSASLRFKLWLTADHGRLTRSQVWMPNQDGQWQLRHDYQMIEYDVEPPASAFALEPPPGYAAANAKETAPLTGLTTSITSTDTYEYSVPVSFTLADGSVVMGWHSSGRKTRESQEPLFASLVFGGPLPKLPVEFFGLKPAGAVNGTTYTGYHLAWTRKANQFMEWGLYVPDGAPPAGVKLLGYDVLCRFNLDPQPKGTIHMADYGFPVGNAADFERCVLGAMAEFSDGGTPPPDVTWQKVVDLAQKIRNH